MNQQCCGDASKNLIRSSTNIGNTIHRRYRSFIYTLNPRDVLMTLLQISCFILCIASIITLLAINVDVPTLYTAFDYPWSRADEWSPHDLRRIPYAPKSYYINHKLHVSRRWSMYHTCSQILTNCERVQPAPYDDPYLTNCSGTHCVTVASHLHVIQRIASNAPHLNEHTHVLVFEDDSIINPAADSLENSIVDRVSKRLANDTEGFQVLGVGSTGIPYAYAMTPAFAKIFMQGVPTWPHGTSWTAGFTLATTSSQGPSCYVPTPSPRSHSPLTGNGLICEYPSETSSALIQRIRNWLRSHHEKNH